MEELELSFRRARNIQLELQQEIEQLENTPVAKCCSLSKDPAKKLMLTVSEHISNLSQIIENIQHILHSNLSSTDPSFQKQRFKLDQVRQAYESIQHSFTLFRRRVRQYEEEEMGREDLFEGHNPGDAHLVIDTMQEERRRIHSAHAMVREQLQVSGALYDELQNQYSFLRSIGDKTSAFFTKLGVSDSTMRSIRRRWAEDKWLVRGCIFVIFLLITGLIWFRRRHRT
eukprot:gnl/Trimastix_PCT/3150.p1 GENE.gnl/Trimastix_PCT/3150~~gnl/Trimastix_PCT/3150.p1  ORF type:complete len:239 (+),score=45.63 gnl/Trimastix_PCT/3150:35-718(+)